MSDETRSALRQAFDAIEAGDLEAARAIIEPVLAAEPDNADAWWIYSHAISDPEQAMTALDNVVRIDPEYPGAAELLSTLRERLPRRPAQPVSSQPPPPPSGFPDLPTADEPEFDLERTPPSGMKPILPEGEEESRRSMIPIIAVVLFVIVILVLVASLLSQNQTPAATPTAVAVASPVDAMTPIPFTLTEEASPEPTGESQVVAPDATIEPGEESTETAAIDSTPVPEMTGEAPEVAATESAMEATAEVSAENNDQALLGGLGRYTLADEPITRQETTLGNAVLVNVCVADRREVATMLRPVMRAVANATAALGSDVEAVGVRMMNCTAGNPLVVMAVDRQSALDHAAGTLSYVEFRERWQPQR